MNGHWDSSVNREIWSVWSLHGTFQAARSERSKSGSIKANNRQTIQVFIFYSLFRVNINCQLSLWSVVADEYASFIYTTKGCVHLKNRNWCALLATCTATSKAQLIFSGCLTKSDASNKNPAGRGIFLFSSLLPHLTLRHSVLLLILYWPQYLPEPSPLQRAEAAESKTRKLTDFVTW